MEPSQRIDLIFSRLSGADPVPKSELNHTSPFTLLVAVILSAQATDIGVNRATRSLFAVVDTPTKMLQLGEDALKTHIRRIGLFNSKARNIIRLCEILLDEHDGEVPRSREALEALPGVGRKTANVVMNVAFGEPTIAVDTHVFRVSNRLGLTSGKTPRAVEADLMKVVPPAFLQHAHHWLILHGRHVCKARNPNCQACILRDLCPHKIEPG